MNGIELITDAALAALILEGIKWLFILFKDDPEFEFSARIVAIALPVLTFASGPLLALLGIEPYVFPSDWLAWGQELISVLLSALASIVVYRQAIKPLADHGKARMRKFVG